MTEAVGEGNHATDRVVLSPLGKRARQGRTVFVGHVTSAVKWLTNARIAFVTVDSHYELVEEDIQDGRWVTLLRARHAIQIGDWDAHRRLLEYAYVTRWTWQGRASVRMTDAMTTLELIAPKWTRAPVTHLRVIHVGTRMDGAVRAVSLRRSKFASPPMVGWRGGDLIGLVTSLKSDRTKIIDLRRDRRLYRDMPLFRLEGLAIAQPGRLAVISTRYWTQRPKPMCGCNGSLNVYLLGNGASTRELTAFSSGSYLAGISHLWWVGGHDLIAQVMGSRGNGGADRWWLEEVNWSTNRRVRSFRWPHGDLGGFGYPCRMDARRTVAICVAQTLRDPPELVEVNLRTGAMRALRKLQPRQRSLNFQFTKIRIRNRFGYVSTGFLALPNGARRHRIPLAVMAYGFTEAYSRDAQWITSYPVARLVHAGIAVLLLNWADIRGLQAGPFAIQQRLLNSAVSTFAHAITAVRAHGVRVSRAMVMGWSFGGLYAAHAIQSLSGYVAAQVGDPADWNVTEYALGNVMWRTVSKWGFGGPPVEPYIRHYVDMDPVGDGKPAHGPILFEFVSRNPAAGQFLEEWRAVGTDVQAFAYHRSVHALTVPAEARVSRLRNLYWAKLNLLGPHSVTRAELLSVGLTVPAHGWWMKRTASASCDRRASTGPDKARCAPTSRRQRSQRPKRGYGN